MENSKEVAKKIKKQTDLITQQLTALLNTEIRILRYLHSVFTAAFFLNTHKVVTI